MDSFGKSELEFNDDLMNNTIQLAENADVEEEVPSSSEEKRKLLEKTKIVKQTWSILEIYQKVQSKKLILDPDYQRNPIWKPDKKTAFIESLYMGILIPPIYVVEIPGESILDSVSYEVVDGKQRLTTILDFIGNKFYLGSKSLEYYTDWFSNKKFAQIQSEYSELTNAMLSSVLDIYVITANSPEFTKYDIFSRLNKGSAPLKVNEIRKAIYQSHTMKMVNKFVQTQLENPTTYKLIFSDNDIKRYEDFGRFFRSIAFYVKADVENDIITGYNSRPREMINDVLSALQKKTLTIEDDLLNRILNATLQLCLIFKDQPNAIHLIDSSIYFATQDLDKFRNVADTVKKDDVIRETLVKSATTTSNVNARFKRIHELMN